MVQWEYKVGPLTINLRVLVEPKGFLRLILLVIALLAFAITAGFNSGSTSNSLRCQGNVTTIPINYTAYVTYNYPYASENFNLRLQNPTLTISNSSNCQSAMQFGTRPLSSSAQFFVAMGVLTMLYVVGAILVYMLFITPELFLAKWLVIADFFVTIVFGVLYLIACIAWSAGAADLTSYAANSLRAFGTACLNCANTDNTQLQSFAQPAISLLFGWLVAFIWLCSVWFVYKDTVWHKDKTGPLASIYGIVDKTKSTGEGQGAQEGGQQE